MYKKSSKEDDLSSIAKDLNIYSPWIRFENMNWCNIIKDEKPFLFKKDTVLYRECEYCDFVYIISEGRVAMTFTNEDGSEKNLGIAEKGSIIGEISLFDDAPNFCTAVVLVDSLIYRIEKNRFYRIIVENKDAMSNLFLNFTKKIRTLYTQVHFLSFKDSVSRIAICLILLSRDHCVKVNNEIKIDIKFTHREMADLTGLSRVSASKVFSKLNDEGIMYKKNGYFYIKDIDKLNQLARK